MGIRIQRVLPSQLDTVLQATSTTVAKGDALKFTSGYAERATSVTAEIHAIALQDQTVAGTALPLEIAWVQVGVEVEIDTNGSTSQALVGTYIDLTDHDTANESASSTNVFFVRGIVGATTDKKVRGIFVNIVA